MSVLDSVSVVLNTAPHDMASETTDGNIHHDSYVEFDLSGTRGNSVAKLMGSHIGNDSTVSLDNDIARNLYKQERSQAASVPNAQAAVTIHVSKPFVQEPPEKSETLKGNGEGEEDDEDDWQEMGATNDDAVFGEKGEVMVDSSHDLGFTKGSAEAYGYTRIAAEQQAEMYQKADKKTDFLFKFSREQDEKLLQPKFVNDNDEDDDDFDDVEEIDDVHKESHSALDQLKTTKKLLTDSEKLAYLGLTKLVMNEMATSLATWGALKYCSSAKSKFAKRMTLAQSSMGQWQLRMTERLYGHLDVSDDEEKMLDALVRHRIEPKDLAKSLQKTSIIDNPAYDKKSKYDDNKEQSETGIVRPEDISSDDKLEIDVTWTAICDLFLVLIADSVYDSRSRTLLMEFAKYLSVDNLDIYQFERRITDALQLEDASDQVWDESDILKDRRKRQRRRKYMYVGLATVGGSLVLGLSAGLLAPVIGAGFAAGLATVGISGTGGFLAGAGGTALVTIGGTAIGARVGSSGMMKRVGDVKTFEFVPLHNNKRTNLIITVSGWMNSKADDIRLPFSTIDPVMGDLYSLLWDPDILQSTGQTMTILASEALTQSIQQILGVTILMAFMSAIQIPMMLSKLSYLIDNPWNVSVDRAWKAGLILADTLISRNLGVRPVTLLGFSLGSRVIYSCLLELSKRGAHGLVENVMIFGSPVVGSDEQLLLARSVVSGRFINGYSKKDWILGYLFRATSGGLGRVMGLSKIESIEGIENFDCTSLVEGHMGYRTSMPKLLKELGFNVLGDQFVEIDEPDPETTERQRKLVLEFDEMRKIIEKDQSEGSTKKRGMFAKMFKPKKKLEWWQTYIDAKHSSEEVLPNSAESDDVVKQIADMQLGDKEDKGLNDAVGDAGAESSNLAEEVDMKDEVDTLDSTTVSKEDLKVISTLEGGVEQENHKEKVEKDGVEEVNANDARDSLFDDDELNPSGQITMSFQ